MNDTELIKKSKTNHKTHQIQNPFLLILKTKKEKTISPYISAFTVTTEKDPPRHRDEGRF